MNRSLCFELLAHSFLLGDSMRKKYEGIYAAVSAVLMLIIILDGKTALHSAISGIDLCLRTVIPSLFPFFVLTGILNSTILGKNIPLLRPISRLCKIQAGTESILMLGLLAGYPVGAQLAGQAHREGNLSRMSAMRMAAFCNNAGPAFIFGILSAMFHRGSIVWLIWCIQIISALFVGWLLPQHGTDICRSNSQYSISVTKTMESATRTMATVCGWVIVFRILLGFLQIWFLGKLPTVAQVLISGLLELSNGCVRLSEVQPEGLRFILACILLPAGGLCITMQTMSISGSIISGTYFLGKAMQVLTSSLLGIVLHAFVFKGTDRVYLSVFLVIALFFAIIAGIFLILRKKM